MKKFLLTFIVYMFSINLAFSGADGVNNLSKKTGEVKDCFERVNRATYAFN